jgi:DNA-binding transcriptional regulator LsrR (DeoR family)
MSTITADQLIDAAQTLEGDEFTRGELAEKLGIKRREMKAAFNEARNSGRLERVREDDDGTRYFRLTAA